MAEDAGNAATPTWLDLYDWRRRVAALYAAREADHLAVRDPLATITHFRAAKDDLFKRHPQSPFDAQARVSFAGLRYFPYNPALRLVADFAPEPAEDTSAEETQLAASGTHTMRFRRAARVNFTIAAQAYALTVYWIDVYGGGLFLPFRDATCPQESYGAGRYLFDTVKGSDFLLADPQQAAGDVMGLTSGRILLDFNYAYNPSCAYDPHWVCPLAAQENTLPIPIRAGERTYHEDHA
ncbi:MAG: DUF1684 domain-containing protein [Ktedonobacterales bacterium]